MQKASNKVRVLNRLKKADWVKGTSLLKVDRRYSARIHDLRNEGHRIETRRDRKGNFHYRHFGTASWLNN